MKLLLLLCLLFISLSSCIGDDIVEDFVPPAVKIVNPVDTLGLDDTWQFEAKYTDNTGREESRPVTWSSNVPAILEISPGGLATGKEKGVATVTASVEGEGGLAVADELLVVVGEATIISPTTRSGEIKTTSSYALKGSFVITAEGGGINIAISEDYMASTALPGLYVYLGNNPNSVAGALEIGQVEVFNGAHSYQVDDVGLNDYTHILYWCKPFNVKVGEGKIN